MLDQDPTKLAIAALSARNWMSFADLEAETGLNQDQIIARKLEIETGLRALHPDIRLTSRIDLQPAGFEVVG